MASWTLSDIFATANEVPKEAAKQEDPSADDDSDSDSEEDDDDVLAREAAFNKSKQSSSNAKTTESQRSVRRYDEFGDFISRSERAHEEKERKERQQQQTTDGRMNRDGSTGDLQGSNKSGVHFASKDNLEDVHEIPRLTDEEKERCFMTTENWVSIDSDIDLTTKRWGYHTEGKLAFDEDNNTIRGIEDMIFQLNKNKPIMKHRKTILEEVLRQKTENEYPNWDKLSKVSQTSSAVQMKMAIELAKEDEKEADRVWDPTRSFAASQKAAKEAAAANNKQSKQKGKGKTKRKSGFFGLFKKK